MNRILVDYWSFTQIYGNKLCFISFLPVEQFLYSLFLSLCLQGGEDEVERAKMREVSKRLYAQLQEAEKKHQEERERLQVKRTDGPDRTNVL